MKELKSLGAPQAEDEEVAPAPKRVAKANMVELTEEITQTRPAFKLPTGEVVTYEVYLVWLGNQIYEVNKKI